MALKKKRAGAGFFPGFFLGFLKVPIYKTECGQKPRKREGGGFFFFASGGQALIEGLFLICCIFVFLLGISVFEKAAKRETGKARLQNRGQLSRYNSYGGGKRPRAAASKKSPKPAYGRSVRKGSRREARKARREFIQKRPRKNRRGLSKKRAQRRRARKIKPRGKKIYRINTYRGNMYKKQKSEKIF